MPVKFGPRRVRLGPHRSRPVAGLLASHRQAAETLASSRLPVKMLRRARAMYRAISVFGIVALLVLMLPACADFKKDFLCRPDGHCVNAGRAPTNIGP
jgi:hypothetical protein